MSEQRVDQNADDTGEKVAHDRQQTAEETHVCLTSSCLVIGVPPKTGLEGACVVARQKRDRALFCEPLILPWRDSTVTPIQ